MPNTPATSLQRIGRRAWLSVLAVLVVSGCAHQPPGPSRHHGREYFPEGMYGHASPRLYQDGQPIPRGGGQYLVGRPYHVAGRWYYPREQNNYVAVGMASWYGDAFHGRRTANGEIYDKRALTAAHPTLPLPSYARVTNLRNGYSVIVRINDRGPYSSSRIMDMSSRVADVLDVKRFGTAKVKLEYLGRAPLEGSDDEALLRTFRKDRPAPFNTETPTIFSSLTALFRPHSPPQQAEPKHRALHKHRPARHKKETPRLMATPPSAVPSPPLRPSGF